MNASQFLCLLIGLIFCRLTLFSQPVNDYIGDYVPSSPNVAAMNKYTDIPVSHFTGVPNINIPIYTIKEGPITVPVNLSYHASGIKVAETASWVGLGWSLSYGGTVNRSIVGIRDDAPGTGYMFGEAQNLVDIYGEGPLAYREIVDFGYDTEPDVYYYSFGGYSGKLIYSLNDNDDNGGWFVYPRNDIKVKHLYEGDSTTIDGFEFITPEGLKYIFGLNEVEKTVASTTNATPTEDAYISSWYLKKISSPDDKFYVEFHYVDEYYKYPFLSSNQSTTTLLDVDDYTCGSTTTTDVQTMYSHVDGKRISSISTSSGQVELSFISGAEREDVDPRQSSQVAKHLDRIEIRSPGDLPADDYCKHFKFEYYYSQVSAAYSYDKRLVLDQVIEKSCSGTAAYPAYEFTYHDLNVLRSRLSKQIDHWGYFNGVTANDDNDIFTLIPSTAYVEYGGQRIYYNEDDPNSTVNRESNATYMKKGVLTKIKYPTGGNTTFQYDANREFGPRRSPGFDYPIANQFSNCNADSNFNFIEGNFNMSAAELETAQFELIFDLDGQSTGCDCENDRFYVKITADVFSDSILIDCNSTFQEGLMLPDSCDYITTGWLNMLDHFVPECSGEPALYADLDYTYLIEILGGPLHGEGDVYFNVRYKPDENNPVAGLRVDKIVSDPGYGDPVVTEFDYSHANGQSNGRIIIEPQYGYLFSASDPVNALIKHFSSAPLLSLSDINGYVFGYESVTEIKNEYRSTYEYQLTKLISSGYPVIPLPPLYDNGKQVAQKHYLGNTNSIVSEDTNIGQIPIFIPSGALDKGRNIFTLQCAGPELTYIYFIPSVYFTQVPSYYRPVSYTQLLDGISTTTNYGYDVLNRYIGQKSVQTTNSDGTIFTTEYTYAPEMYTDLHYLNTHNMIGIPLETKINGGLAGGTKVVYSNALTSGVILPIEFYSAKADSSWRLEKEILSVNTDGFPTAIKTRKQELPINLIWAADTTKRGQLEKVVHGIRETRYSYKNRIQLDSIINFDGLATAYSYDDMERLKTVTDRNGNRVLTYDYGYGIPTVGGNYIKTRADFAPVQGNNDTSEISWQYFDGLGRMVQTVNQAHSPDQLDVAVTVQYDSVGRVFREYEPWESPTESDGSFKPFIGDSTNEHTLTTYEQSSLNRPLSVTPVDGHTTTYAYGKNSPVDVYNYQTNSFYPYATLVKNTVVDPNGNKSIVYTDKRGRKVASFMQAATGGATAKTHYLYDDRDRLTMILPPDKTPADTTEIYRFSYDVDDNIIEKKIPGKLPVLYRYNDHDMVDSMKDGIHDWLSYTYDNYEREVASKEGDKVLSVKTYGGSTPIELGKLTYEHVYYSPNRFVYKYYEYDSHGRVDSIYGNHHLCSPARNEPCYLETKYHYDFADNMIRSDQYLKVKGLSELITTDEMTYDHASRVVDHFYTVDGQQQKIANHSYTIKDQVKQKNLGWSGSNYLQTLDFEYLPNGFLKSINQPLSIPQLPYATCVTGPPPNADPSDDLFYLELGYDESIQPDLPFVSRNNGDISQMVWQTAGRQRSGYGFNYDYLNRLTDAHYESIKENGTLDAGQVDKYDSHITYADKLGNIASLNRKGVVIDTTPCAPKEDIDLLSYSYYPNSSLIQDIDDGAEAGREGYPSYAIAGADYLYDANGNMTYDPSRQVTIVYNRHNLPDSLIFDDGKLITNLYNDVGSKLAQSQWLADGTLVERRDYITNVELVNGAIQAIHHDEGRVVKADGPSVLILPDTIDNQQLYFYAANILAPTVILGQSDVLLEARDSITMLYPFQVHEPMNVEFEARIDTSAPDTSWQWEYYIKDHLGNLRLTFSDLNNDGQINVSLEADNEILEEHHYYPFGLTYDGPWLQRKDQGMANRYNYNGKEEMPLTGYLEYGARVYDPGVARFVSVDPLADRGPHWSPYVYTFNNPIKYTDPDGRWPIETIWDIGNVIYDVGSAIVDHVNGDHESAKGHWIDAGADFGAVLIPYVPAGALKLRHADDAVKLVDDYADNLVKQASQKGTDAHKAAKADIVGESGEGVIYKVDGSNTPSGRPYIGSADDMTKRAKTARDGRDRTNNTAIIGGYQKGNKTARKTTEQQAILDNGGVNNLDNKRNEIKPSDWKKYGIDN